MAQMLDYIPALWAKDRHTAFKLTEARAREFVLALPEDTPPLEALRLWFEAEEARRGCVL